MSYFVDLMDNVTFTKDVVEELLQEVRLIKKELKELQKMADTRLSAIDAALNDEDTEITQLEKDETSNQQTIKDLTAKEASLQAQIDLGNSSVDTSAELLKIKEQKARLQALDANLKSQLETPVVVVPATTPSDVPVVSSPDNNAGSTTLPNPSTQNAVINTPVDAGKTDTASTPNSSGT